jgi:hypothetical protein
LSTQACPRTSETVGQVLSDLVLLGIPPENVVVLSNAARFEGTEESTSRGGLWSRSYFFHQGGTKEVVGGSPTLDVCGLSEGKDVTVKSTVILTGFSFLLEMQEFLAPGAPHPIDPHKNVRRCISKVVLGPEWVWKRADLLKAVLDVILEDGTDIKVDPVLFVAALRDKAAAFQVLSALGTRPWDCNAVQTRSPTSWKGEAHLYLADPRNGKPYALAMLIERWGAEIVRPLATPQMARFLDALYDVGSAADLLFQLCPPKGFVERGQPQIRFGNGFFEANLREHQGWAIPSGFDPHLSLVISGLMHVHPTLPQVMFECIRHESLTVIPWYPRPDYAHQHGPMWYVGSHSTRWRVLGNVCNVARIPWQDERFLEALTCLSSSGGTAYPSSEISGIAYFLTTGSEAVLIPNGQVLVPIKPGDQAKLIFVASMKGPRSVTGATPVAIYGVQIRRGQDGSLIFSPCSADERHYTWASQGWFYANEVIGH